MKNKTACFTGHRRIPSERHEMINTNLTEVLVRLIREGYRYFGAGGALGFDTIAAQAVLRLKSQYPHIALILVLPCHSQTRGWNEHDRAVYEHIKARADKIVYTAREYSRGCMYKRNRHLVEHSSICICYLTDGSGGTAYTVGYARALGLPVINVAHGKVNDENNSQIIQKYT